MSLRNPAGSAASLKAYFAQYPGFNYNESKPATSEFRRLCTFLDRKDGKASREEELQAFADTLGNQFRRKYGAEMNDLEAWQSLCHRIGINPVPRSLQAAQEAVRTTHFNMIDIIDVGPDGRVQTFPNRKALKAYSFNTKKRFPRQCSTAGSIMALLLGMNPPIAAATPTTTIGHTVVGPVNAASSTIHNLADDTPPLDEIIEEIYSPGTRVSRREPASPATSTTVNAHTVRSPSNPDDSRAPLARFFARYQGVGFGYDPGAVPMLEYHRLLRVLRIPRIGLMSDSIFKEFAKAMVDEFGTKFGTSADDLTAWQRLCKRIGIDPVPATLPEARAEFKKTHVNLVELIMVTSIADGEMEKFETEEKLAAYTRSMPGLTFPRKAVPKGSLLEHLLRYIWNDPDREENHLRIRQTYNYPFQI